MRPPDAALSHIGAIEQGADGKCTRADEARARPVEGTCADVPDGARACVDPCAREEADEQNSGEEAPEAVAEEGGPPNDAEAEAAAPPAP